MLGVSFNLQYLRRSFLSDITRQRLRCSFNCLAAPASQKIKTACFWHKCMPPAIGFALMLVRFFAVVPSAPRPTQQSAAAAFAFAFAVPVLPEIMHATALACLPPLLAC